MTGMLPGPVTLTTATLLAVIRWRQAEPHPVLADIPTWHDDTALRAQTMRTREELDQHTLISGDRLDPDFDDLLGALIRPDRELYGWINTIIDGWPQEYSVLAGVAYQQGFLLVRDPAADTVTLQAIRPADLLDGFTAHLPPERPAQQVAITVCYEDFVAATARMPHDGFAGFGKPNHPDIRAIQAIFTQPRHGAGNLYAAARRRTGTRVRIPHPINYIDTPNGRWLTELTNANGRVWASATPATSQTVVTRLSTHIEQIKESAPISQAGCTAAPAPPII